MGAGWEGSGSGKSKVRQERERAGRAGQAGSGADVSSAADELHAQRHGPVDAFRYSLEQEGGGRDNRKRVKIARNLGTQPCRTPHCRHDTSTLPTMQRKWKIDR